MHKLVPFTHPQSHNRVTPPFPLPSPLSSPSSFIYIRTYKKDDRKQKQNFRKSKSKAERRHSSSLHAPFNRVRSLYETIPSIPSTPPPSSPHFLPRPILSRNPRSSYSFPPGTFSLPTTSFTCSPFLVMAFTNWMRWQRYLNQSPPNADGYPAKPILKPKKVDDIYNVALRSVSSLDLGDVIDAFPETPRSPQPPSQASQASQCPLTQVADDLVDEGEAGDTLDGRLDYQTQAIELHHSSEDQHTTASLHVAPCSIEASESQVEHPSFDTPLSPNRETSEDNALISAAERDCTVIEDVSLLDSTCETHGPGSCKIEYEFETGDQTCYHPSNTESDTPFKTPDEDDGADTNV
ncbi:hypothetical protein SISNIDRAFT_480383 [Sistotremastrum niveocremeum HHB9708]|uniref:Uncharacterized protein n=1 Tax=Sistotremastrum niveocremeum HHB9708 TaxID=1314777 RepID=A0A165AC86_9AGAM|nr:hypothetical protein SISNIDRAFT_480383 [Sistotremastrum niveocremeum HHB9708]